MTRDERHAFWRRHVASWQAGDESQAAYCRRMGLSAMTFSQWKRRFERERLSGAVSDDSAALVEVEVADADRGSGEAGITVDIGGLQLRLARDFDTTALQRAVAALTDAGR